MLLEQPSKNSSSNISSLSSLLEKVNDQIKDQKSFQCINLKITLSEIKPFRSMKFLRVFDDTCSINAVIYGSNYVETLKTDDTIDAVCKLCLYKSQLQLIINSYKICRPIISEFDRVYAYIQDQGWLNTPKPNVSTNYDKIGIISSVNAAGFKDFCYTIINRCVGKTFYLYNTKVQGVDADLDIMNAIICANNHNVCQVLALIRGGGSKEDLACFNSEKLAECIYLSAIPIVTGIGHQIDTSIADIIAAKSFITPTAVAENVVVSNLSTNTIAYLQKFADQTRDKIEYLLKYRLNYIIQTKKLLYQYRSNILAKYNNKISQYESYNMINDMHEYLKHNISRIETHMTNYSQNIQHNIIILENTALQTFTIIEQYIASRQKQIKGQSEISIYDNNDIVLHKSQLKVGNVYKLKIMNEWLNIKIMS